jgi:hypothetical protein
VWALLLVPVALYYVVGATPGAARVQDDLERPGLFHLLVVLPAVAGLGFLAWQLVAGARGLPAALGLPDGERAARVQLRLATALGALALGAVTLGAWLLGTRPGGRVLSNVHVLDALATGLLIAGIVLAVGAVVFFPPSIGVVAATTTAGTTILVPTATVSGAFVTTATLGAGSIVLSNAASNAADAGRPGSGPGSPGSPGSPVPDIPQKPPAKMPEVRHWKLRRIVDDLYRGTTNSERVGDGTTMDAVRNEIRTGRPTEGRWHSQKARDCITRLDRWLERFGSQATATDREWAYRLRGQLQKALEGT